jgi:hypothetical protein
VDEQQPEQRALLGAAERNWPGRVDDLERPEDPELHRDVLAPVNAAFQRIYRSLR